MAELSPAQDRRLDQIVTRNYGWEKTSYWIGLRRRNNQYRWRNCLNGQVSVPDQSDRWLKRGGQRMEPNYDGQCVLKFVGLRTGYVDYNCNQIRWTYERHGRTWTWPIYALCESGTRRPGRECLRND